MLERTDKAALAASSSSSSPSSSLSSSSSVAAVAGANMPVHSINGTLKQVMASSCGAIVTAVLMTPLDVVKIRLQSQNHVKHKGECFVYRNGLMDHVCTCSSDGEWFNRKIPGGRYTGTLDAMAKIVRVEGLRSLWSGLPPTLVMAFPQVVLYFTTYEETKRLMGYHEITNPNPLIPILSGGVARLFAVTAISPIELFRTKIQSEQFKYSQIFDIIRSEVKTQGVKVLYRGWVSTVWRDVPFSMIYWFNYETLKTLLIGYNSGYASSKTGGDKLSSMYTFALGTIAGAVAATLTCPLDVVKTYRQVKIGELDTHLKYRRIPWILKDIYRLKGVKGIFAGLGPRVTKVSMSCAIMITTFEYFKKIFGD